MMLYRLVHLSLRHRGVLIVLALVLAAYGVFVSRQAKLDVFPEFVQPQVVVQTEAPGLAPEQVEALVTRRVETTLNGIGHLESIRSESIQGLSVITVVFEEGTDIYKARQMLAESLVETAGELPLGVKAPKMSQLTSSTMDLLKFGLISDTRTPMELRTFTDWVVRPRVLAVSGVARVNVFGGEVRQLQIQVDPRRLASFDLSIQDVITAARDATGVYGAGFIETAGQRIVLQSDGASITADQLGNIIVAGRQERGIHLREVANVVEAGEPKFGDALINGRPGVLLTMSGQYEANTMEVTEAVEKALDDMKPLFAAENITYVPRLHRPATFIEHALDNVKDSLLIGGGLVAVVLLLFLLDWRTAFISFISIPLSLLTAVIVLDHFGATINTMTLGGFAVAIGVVVDDAIIDVENILRRLRENVGLARPQPVFDVILHASLEVRSAVVYATFVVMLVFVPVLMMTGLQGRFFQPLGVAFILSVLASLVVALTLTPALCYALLAKTRPHAEPKYIRGLKRLHTVVLARMARFPTLVIFFTLLLCVGAASFIPYLGGGFLPEFREGHFVLQANAAPGTSLQEMLRIGRQLSEELLADTQHIASVEQQVGRAEMGEDTWGPHRSEFHVELKPLPGEQQEDVQEHIRQLLESYPGIQTEVLTFLGDRIGETMSGETAQVVINLFGEDLDMLDTKSTEVAQVLNSIPGHADVQVKSPPGSPRMVARLRPDRLAQYGFRPVPVLEAIQTAYQGAVAAQTYEGNRVFDVNVILAPELRRDPETIGDLLISNDQGVRIPLRELADVYPTSGRYIILHDGARRRQTVTCNVTGRDVSSFVDEARKAVTANVMFPAGVYPVYSGAAEQQAAAQHELLLHSGLALAGILILLGLVFHHWRNLALVLVNLPFAMVGGILAVRLTGASLSIGSLVGFVTLFGITMRNSIMLVSHYDHLVQHESCTWGLDTMLRGTRERLLPILMTALVTGLGLLPLALGTGEAGREIEGPMAIVILGGLISSTLLSLLVLPALALQAGTFRAEIS